jgi:lactate permease
VALALLGHAAGVSFGAVGTPALAQIELLGLHGSQLAALTMMVHALPLCVLALWVMRLATDAPLTRRHAGIALLAALCFLIPALLLAWLAGPELPTLGGALIGGAIFAGVMRSRHLPRTDERNWRLADLAPYLLIVALVLLTRLIPPVQGALSSLWLGWEWSGFSGGFAPLYHPGTLLAAGLVTGALLTGRGALLGPAIGAALRRLTSVALALLVMLALARLMVHGGLIAQLAGAASQAGALWPLLSPFIGVLGTFVSGSATASNILFTDFQAATARALDLPVVLMAAAQGVGAAIGNAIAPHNIIAGAATVGLSGRDGEVLARTLIPALTYTACAGIIVFIASR